MRRHGILLLMVILMALPAMSGQADEIITVTVTFDPDELTWEVRDGYQRPRLDDCDVTREVGAPQLPARSVQVVLPAGRSVSRVEVTGTSSRLLPGRRQISPAQPDQILSRDAGKSRAIDVVPPDPAVYRGQTPYPERIAEYTGSGQMGPVHLANVVIYPLQYLPRDQQVRFHQRVEPVSYTHLRAHET